MAEDHTYVLMMTSAVDESRLEAFADAISDARISTRRSRRRALQVIGEPGCGKTTLALAYAARNKDTRVIGPEWLPASERASLHPSMRASLVETRSAQQKTAAHQGPRRFAARRHASQQLAL